MISGFLSRYLIISRKLNASFLSEKCSIIDLLIKHAPAMHSLKTIPPVDSEISAAGDFESPGFITAGIIRGPIIAFLASL